MHFTGTAGDYGTLVQPLTAALFTVTRPDPVIISIIIIIVIIYIFIIILSLLLLYPYNPLHWHNQFDVMYYY